MWVQLNKVNVIWWAMVDEMKEMDCGLKEMRWNIKNEVDNVTSPSLSLTTWKWVKNKCYTLFLFVCLFVYKITQFVQLTGI